uniref:EF-hand domain-containing protein n=1 Tax=Neobodo designis TaxID=312471 RepID=A0A7S1L037_NEODS
MMKARRGRSASVAKLEEIAKRREQDDEVEREEEDAVNPQEPAVEDEVDTNPSPSRTTRHRRLSSIYTDFSSQMSEFWRQKEDNEETEEQEQTLRRMFDNLDINSTGYITCDALEEGFRRMGLTSSSAQVVQMFKLADKDKDGALSFNEFFQFFRSMASLDTVNAEEADELQALKNGPLPVRRRGVSVSVRFLRNFSIRPFSAGFAKRVKSIALSPGRPLVAAVDRDDKIAHIFDADSGRELRRLVGHQDSMLAVIFSPDRKTVATASRDNTLTLWDCTVGHELCSCRHPGVVTACDFSFDGKFIYTGCQDNLVRKLLTSKGRCQRLMDRLPQTQLGVIVALGAQQTMDKKIIMARSCDKCAHVLDADKLVVQGTLLGHSGMVWHCGFNHDDTLMITQCDKFIKLWSAADNSPRFSIASATMPGPKKPPARRSRLWTTVAFGPQDFSSVIIAAANDSMVYVLRIDTGDVLVAIEAKSSVYALAVGGVRDNVLFGDDVGNMFELHLY